MSEPDFDLTAMLDQRASEGGAVARVIASFYLALEEAGVPEQAAAEITSTWLEIFTGTTEAES